MMTRRGPLRLVILQVVSGIGLLQAAELQRVTKSAWESYVAGADVSMGARVVAGGVFLWSDEAPERNQRVRSGSILVVPGMGNGTRAVPGGLVHHWLAAAFIPQAKLSDVLQVAHDYANYKRFYGPDVIDSRLLSGEQPSFSMRTLHRVLFITAVLDSQFATRDFQVAPKRWYIVANSTRVQEVENYGKPDERVLPPDRGKGFVWRLHTITRYEERDDGVYVEMEAIALSRDIPAALRWLLNPVVARFSQNELVMSLRQTRDAVTAAGKAAQSLNWAAAGGTADGRR